MRTVYNEPQRHLLLLDPLSADLLLLRLRFGTGGGYRFRLESTTWLVVFQPDFVKVRLWGHYTKLGLQRNMKLHKLARTRRCFHRRSKFYRIMSISGRGRLCCGDFYRSHRATFSLKNYTYECVSVVYEGFHQYCERFMFIFWFLWEFWTLTTAIVHTCASVKQ